jgi:hypothetical protein
VPDGLHAQIEQVPGADQFDAVNTVADSLTAAPSPKATPTTCRYTPTALPTTVSRAPRLPTVSARLMVNRTLGPGTTTMMNVSAANATK